MFGAIAQLGERYNGIVEVVGSIPIGSTKQGNIFSKKITSSSRISSIAKTAFKCDKSFINVYLVCRAGLDGKAVA